MGESIEKINYRGCVIEIYQDDDPQSPEEWEDDEVFLVGWSQREFWVGGDKNCTPNFYKGIYAAIMGFDEEEYEGQHDEAKDYAKKYHLFGVEAYIHSGIVLALNNEGNFCDRRWDVSSNIGCVFVRRSKGRTKESARRIAQGIIETWNDYLSGNVYGYTSEAGSCWGFYGDYRENGMIEEAKAEIDNYIKSVAEKHAKKLKAQIRNNVPIEKRESLAL